MAEANPAGDIAAGVGALFAAAVFKLLPVKYQISLHYLGANRVAHQGTVYNCTFELLKENGAQARQAEPANDNVPPAARADPGATLVAAPAAIGNVLREVTKYVMNGDKPKMAGGKPVVNPAALPGIPLRLGGTNVDPAADDVYRIRIVDKHGIAAADVNAPTDAVGMLGTMGDTVSRPANYDTRNWSGELTPAVPFRVVIAKFVGPVQVDVEAKDALELQLEIKDPKEEYDQNDGKRWQFFRNFYRTYNRSGKNPNPGDDNASKTFRGARTPSAKQPGALPSLVIKTIDYVSPPVAAEAAGAANAVPFASLKAATDHWQGGMRGKVQVVDGPAGVGGVKKKIGVFDFAFMPPPVGGDNYRFLLTLLGEVDDKKKTPKRDVREQVVHGAAVTVVDDQGREIKPGVAYTTGRFVIWRRIDFSFIVFVNNTTLAGVNWATVISKYRKCFVEITQPARSYNATQADWIGVLRQKYGNHAAFTNNAQMTTDFARQLVPAALITDHTYGGFTDQFDLAQRMITMACGKVAPVIGAPVNNAAQTDGNGLFMMLSRKANPAETIMGAYIGDRMFYMFEVGNTPSTTSTTAHELGHALYLRHSHTSRTDAVYVDVTNTPTMVEFTNGKEDAVFQGHDHADAYACLMSYTRPITAEPCAACVMGLRHYDMVAVRKTKTYQSWNRSKIASYEIVRGTMQNWAVGGVNKNLLTLNAAFTVANGGQANLFGLGPVVAFVDRGGSNVTGRANFTLGQAAGDVTWSVATVSGGGTATVTQDPGTGSAILRGTHTGVVRITFKRFDITTTAQCNVT